MKVKSILLCMFFLITMVKSNYCNHTPVCKSLYEHKKKNIGVPPTN